MSLKSPQKLDRDEISFFGALGWLSALSTAIAVVAVGLQ